jgi:hypothetical protein
MWPVGRAEEEGEVGEEITGPGVVLEINACRVPVKSGAEMGGAVNSRTIPGPKIPANNKKPQTSISPAAK